MDSVYSHELPEDLNEATVIRIGSMEAPISLFCRYGIVKQIDGKYFRLPGTNPRPKIPQDSIEAPDPLSLSQLEARGYQVAPGKKVGEDMINIGLNTWMKITHAIHDGYITPTSKPINILRK